jgi:hypothetical protein
MKFFRAHVGLPASDFAKVSSFMHMSMVIGLPVTGLTSELVAVHSPERRGKCCCAEAAAVVMRANKAIVANLGKVIGTRPF